MRPERLALALQALFDPQGLDGSVINRVRQKGDLIAGGFYPGMIVPPGTYLVDGVRICYQGTVRMGYEFYLSGTGKDGKRFQGRQRFDSFDLTTTDETGPLRLWVPGDNIILPVLNAPGGLICVEETYYKAQRDVTISPCPTQGLGDLEAGFVKGGVQVVFP